MKLESVQNCFIKLIQICGKNGFLNIGRTDSSTAICYGPLGSLLKRNVFREWLFSVLNNSDATVFPVERQSREGRLLLEKIPREAADYLLSDVVGIYIDTLPVVGCNLPFGIAAYGHCVNSMKVSSLKESTDSVLKTNLRGLKAWTRMSLAFFTPRKKATHWFHYWSRQRYLWWRKFSSIPSKFSLSEVVKTPEGNEHLSIHLEFPWGNELLETTTLYENNFSKDLWACHSSKHISNKNFADMPSIVTCETELDMAVLAYLANSYTKKLRGEEIRNVFQLHYKLAPYKVCFSLEGNNMEFMKQLDDIRKHLTKELKCAGILVLPKFDINPLEDTQFHYVRFDEMGIPYTVVLNDNVLQTGIVGLRNRDTTVQEQIHISELTSKLLKYLQIRTLDQI
ncbi:DNA polymerase subunit gamma-2, mitochondrial-like [Stegodyphus dumicola]|uniref:DNA polymerase subunit gamma-2, mitochondrial-like n=1 Tax=Stegodyphus dumicola TaxID=202533 RepID=UPI0015ACB377|nr:DNA polymerase subunit gamma-2, mitochondrial-like [Stegodyphus dumicola]XP_035223789.1 DNA polymerase subunit gamma-2, mitochondrial-like [Stegodyphus dumicola]XP_035223790.1 DNA polymerase subunit gamma-2, mitochondrial-like [Stegodyphus dumicola]XP_035223791.1 DNA polymerase subunit gamma-2, mitochondrial-like [Stegodyphus dumicola]XP_035223792.1 DNA polymerase subunit gamma-2, mitochondrial-like [Stegodyphus dumicola]XP_035223794.1 DNA polymerase subunit gamma-2, mitochondrial-like [Ste